MLVVLVGHNTADAMSINYNVSPKNSGKERENGE